MLQKLPRGVVWWRFNKASRVFVPCRVAGGADGADEEKALSEFRLVRAPKRRSMDHGNEEEASSSPFEPPPSPPSSASASSTFYSSCGARGNQSASSGVKIHRRVTGLTTRSALTLLLQYVVLPVPLCLATKAWVDGDDKALDQFCWVFRRNFWTSGSRVSKAAFVLEADRWMLRSELDRLRGAGRCRRDSLPDAYSGCSRYNQMLVVLLRPESSNQLVIPISIWMYP